MEQSLLDTVPQPAKASLLDNPSMGVGAVYLMRHGSTVLDVTRRSDGWLDMPLSDDGRMSVVPAQQYLKTIPLKTIVCADLKRTKQTAHIVASGTMSDPDVVPANDGRTWNLGIIAGTKKQYGRPEVQKLIDSPDTAPMGGESFNDFRDRFLPWFNEQVESATRVDPVLYVGLRFEPAPDRRYAARRRRRAGSRRGWPRVLAQGRRELELRSGYGRRGVRRRYFVRSNFREPSLRAL